MAKNIKAAEPVDAPKPPINKRSTKPTPVKPKKISKPSTKKPAKKISKKATKKPKVQKPIDEKQAMEWFMAQPADHFVLLCEQWNEKNLKIKLPKNKDYDGWLNYFKMLPPNTIKALSITGKDTLPTEAYAALSRWHDIITNPHRIDKIHQAGLTRPETGGNHKSISELALENDQLGVLMAMRRDIAEKMERGVGARDLGVLSRQMGEIMAQIREIEKKAGPKKTTKLGELLSAMPQPIASTTAPKRARAAKSRNTSFRARMTIDDVEGPNGA